MNQKKQMNDTHKEEEYIVMIEDDGWTFCSKFSKILVQHCSYSSEHGSDPMLGNGAVVVTLSTHSPDSWVAYSPVRREEKHANK